ncbi:hypothetical protein BJX63DRAFT_233518 [Aspergillus granulosus]|uniref:Uncharacterized protein n=1 Tax=Aspergillus granulosus TaxID=176169 RepID=A0ABR4HDV7_9EURO
MLLDICVPPILIVSIRCRWLERRLTRDCRIPNVRLCHVSPPQFLGSEQTFPAEFRKPHQRPRQDEKGRDDFNCFYLSLRRSHQSRGKPISPSVPVYQTLPASLFAGDWLASCDRSHGTRREVCHTAKRSSPAKEGKPREADSAFESRVGYKCLWIYRTLGYHRAPGSAHAKMLIFFSEF